MASTFRMFRRSHRSTSASVRWVTTFVCFLSALPVCSGATVVNGLMTTTVDQPLRYDATGPVNTSSEWTDNTPPAIVGPWYVVPGLAPPPAGGANWAFSVRHTATQFTSKQATNASLHVEGDHIQVPAPGHNEPLNHLPEISTPAVNVPLNKFANAMTWGGLQHLGADPPHLDTYGVVGTRMQYSIIGATATLGGKVDVFGRHSESLPKEYKSWRIGSSVVSTGMQNRPDGSTISFNAQTGLLSFNPGSIDVLDMQGGLSRSVDPLFANDSMRGAHLSVSPLTFLGLEPDGRFRFSGGMLNVAGQSGQSSLQASFDEYIIGDTSEQVALDSFGVLTRGSASEIVEQNNPSFLEMFGNDHLMQQLPTGTQFTDRVIDLAFITAPGLDLARLTNGFTTSALFVPADIYVGGNGYNVTTLETHPGDYNGDGLADFRDYQVWRAEFGNPAGSADGNGNGVTDAADYVLWRKNAGTNPITTVGRLSATGIAVPEPSILLLAIVGLCLTCSGRQLRAVEILKLNDRRRGVVRLESPQSSNKSLPDSKRG